MTAPDLSFVIPSKWKTYTVLIGGALGLFVPQIVELTADLPQPWPLVIGAVIWVLTALGVYRAPYVPPGAVVVPVEAVPPSALPTGTVVDGNINITGEYRNPWR